MKERKKIVEEWKHQGVSCQGQSISYLNTDSDVSVSLRESSEQAMCLIKDHWVIFILKMFSALSEIEIHTTNQSCLSLLL